MLSPIYNSHREITMYGNTYRKYGFPVLLGFRHLSCIRYHYIFACISVLVQFYMLYIPLATKFYHSNKMILASSLKRLLFNIGRNFYIIGTSYVENVDDKKNIEHVPWYYIMYHQRIYTVFWYQLQEFSNKIYFL